MGPLLAVTLKAPGPSAVDPITSLPAMASATVGLTRRDLLRIGPAAAAAMAFGCAPRAPSSSDLALDTGRIRGRIVGASHETGHRLREGTFPEPEAVRDIPVVIVGAGMAGLSAAWKLAKSGFDDFVVLELEGEAGGNARWWSGATSLTRDAARACACWRGGRWRLHDGAQKLTQGQ